MASSVRGSLCDTPLDAPLKYLTGGRKKQPTVHEGEGKRGIKRER